MRHLQERLARNIAFIGQGLDLSAKRHAGRRSEAKLSVPHFSRLTSRMIAFHGGPHERVAKNAARTTAKRMAHLVLECCGWTTDCGRAKAPKRMELAPSYASDEVKKAYLRLPERSGRAEATP
jgi:hypothetical protein